MRVGVARGGIARLGRDGWSIEDEGWSSSRVGLALRIERQGVGYMANGWTSHFRRDQPCSS